MQFGRGFLEAAEAARGLERAQCIKRGKRPFHSRKKIYLEKAI
jgi:hypothetical protein